MARSSMLSDDPVPVGSESCRADRGRQGRTGLRRDGIQIGHHPMIYQSDISLQPSALVAHPCSPRQPRVFDSVRWAGNSAKGPLPMPAGYPLQVTFGPGAIAGVPTSSAGGRVEYLLARNAVVRDFHKGRLSRLDVCDAHPELLRAARNLGRSTGEPCPICERVDLVDVTFAFGARLPAGGRCVSTQAELDRFWKRKDPVACFVVEVCIECSWNHLNRMYPAGSGVAGARLPLHFDRFTSRKGL